VETSEKIARLKEQRDAVILAHNYQRPEIQDVADFVGDSLELSIKASRTEAKTILFCAVTFMAETAKILSPRKKVLVPRRDSRCPMADMVTVDDLIRAKAEHPSAAVVSYVNTKADGKAESDICCTSANAVNVVESLDEDEVIFVPDMNLAHYVSTQTRKKIIPWKGFCLVHARMLASEVEAARARRPEAVVLVHPECPPDVVDLADEVLSTSGMVRYANRSDAREFLVATEEGILHRMGKENPGKTFMPAGTPRVCSNMKKITLDDVVRSLETETYEVSLDESTIARASSALKRMVEIS